MPQLPPVKTLHRSRTSSRVTLVCEPLPQKMATGPAPLRSSGHHVCTLTQARLHTCSSLKHMAGHTCTLVPMCSPTYKPLLTCACSTKSMCSPNSTCPPTPTCSPTPHSRRGTTFPRRPFVVSKLSHPLSFPVSQNLKEGIRADYIYSCSIDTGTSQSEKWRVPLCVIPYTQSKARILDWDPRFLA